MTGVRGWPAALAAFTGSVTVGFMPILARHLYTAGLDAPSMLLWRYAIALPALIVAALAVRIDLIAAWRGGAWKIVLVGATLGVGQTITFWESIRYIDTGLAVLLFYTYPVLTLVLDRVLFNRAIRCSALFCVAIILLGAGFTTVPALHDGGIDRRGLAWIIPSPVIYAFYLAVNSTLLRRQQPLTGAIGLYLGMALTFGATCLVQGLVTPRGVDTWFLMLAAALGTGALVITLFAYSVPRLGPSSYAIIANIELVTVVAVGVSLLGEPITAERVGGGLLIVAGIVGYGLMPKREAASGIGDDDPMPMPSEAKQSPSVRG